MRAGIALGSNLGDRLAHLRQAKERLLSLHSGPGPFLCSKIYETSPVDCPEDSPLFLNAAIELSSPLPPLDLLARLQQIEVDLGRPKNHEFHGPRSIDLDLLYCDSLQISHTLLTLPHPGIPSRLFVLHPLSDICPERALPGAIGTIRILCDLCEKQQASTQKIKTLSFFL